MLWVGELKEHLSRKHCLRLNESCTVISSAGISAVHPDKLTCKWEEVSPHLSPVSLRDTEKKHSCTYSYRPHFTGNLLMLGFKKNSKLKCPCLTCSRTPNNTRQNDKSFPLWSKLKEQKGNLKSKSVYIYIYFKITI